MRIALISDVHTNLAAWDALMQHWQGEEGAFEQLWSLGDWLGYHANYPVFLWDRLKRNNHPAIRDLYTNPARCSVIGNHDLGVLDDPDRSPGCNSNGDAQQVITTQQEMVRHSSEWATEFCPWLRKQSYLLSPQSGVYLAHGVFVPGHPHRIPCWYAGRDLFHERSLTQLNKWLQNDPQDSDQIRADEGWHPPVILVTGHTHVQGIWQRPDPPPPPKENWPMVDAARISETQIQLCLAPPRVLKHTVTVPLSLERPVWINPGSVGQQRDPGTPRPGEGWEWARYAMLDWDAAKPTEATIHLYWLPYKKA